jgi:hypothetical protein
MKETFDEEVGTVVAVTIVSYILPGLFIKL